ncbi:major facilitator superfamily domain-containing protein [Mycena amicta]|nr:major facilitator superfamily domain-containing protein [Mycena amicta]
MSRAPDFDVPAFLLRRTVWDIAASRPSSPLSTTMSATDTDVEAQLASSRDSSNQTLGDKPEDAKPEDAKPEAAKPQLPTTLAPDDPENPRNWSTRKKILVDGILCVLPALVQKFHISLEVAVLGVTLNILGFAAGPLIFGPASEIYGRRLIYRISGLGYSAFAFGVAFSPNMKGILAMRFFDGFFGSASINNVPASIGDFTTLQQRLQFSAVYALMAFGGPSLGPLISSFIETYAGFRWNLRVIAIFATWKLAKQNKELAKNLKTDYRKLAAVFKVALSRPLLYLFTEPVVMLVSIYLAILYGILYGFFEAFTVVWIRIRGFSVTSYGLTYISLGLGFLTAVLMLIILGQKLYLKSAASDVARGIPVQPEARLNLGYYGAILCPISLFIFAWTAPFPHVHWIAPCIGEYLFAVSMLLIFTGFIPFLIDCYQVTAASALAAGMTSRALIGGAFPLFSIQMYDKLTVQGATCLLAGISCLCAPIPFIFKYYGTRLRARSQHAVAQSSK